MSESLFGSFDNLPAGITLSQYTNAITNAVATAPGLAGVWVIAELSDVRTSGGHCYLELIEKNDAGQTIAKLRANIWRTNFQQLRQKFYNATQRDITSGIKALVRGSATHHSIYGLSFNIIDIDPSYTMGDMERLRREIIQRLIKEGLAHKNKSLKIPSAPQRIAVISAEGAAGYGDFMNQLCGNSEGFVFYPHLFPCVMQGDKVSESIRNSLSLIEATIDLWDCVVIVRGGGATTDLNGFDDYQLAKAVATFALPVVVGIGHERDRNVLDEIANTSLKTPTAVAGFFIDKMREAYDNVIGIADKLRAYSNDLIRGEERRLSTLQGFIPQLALRRLEDAKSKLSKYSGTLPLLTGKRLSNEELHLQGFLNVISNLAGSKVGKENLKIDSKINLMSNLLNSIIHRETLKTDNYMSLLKVLNPSNTLRRGYSITRVNGKAVTSIKNVESGTIIVTTLADGEIKSEVK